MTEQLAEKLGSKLHGGEVIELIGDLGGGKTTFVRGLARGMGSQDTVRSPSFAIANRYKAGELILHHFDFYRLDDPGLLAHELSEIMEDSAAVVVVEWASIVAPLLQAPHLSVTLQQTGENDRAIAIDYPKKYNYIFQE
jgi:tRNA threonylcarbamoyladenosine biosynthesis protein TsaE